MEYLKSQSFAVKFIQDLIPELIQIKQEATNPNTSIQRLFELAEISKEMARLVAQNIGATPQLLQSLSASNDVETRQNVIANPNTPTDVLLALGSEFPKQLLNNPIFSLLWLENPNLVDEIPPRTLQNILKEETVPIFLMEWAANQIINPQIQLALTINPKTPKNLLENLLETFYGEVQEAARLHVNIAGEINFGWKEIAQQEINNIYLNPDDKQHANYLYRKSLIPNFVSLQLGQHPHKDIRSLIAADPNTPIKLLQQLAQDEDKNVRYHVASNPNTPVEILMQLMEDKNSSVRGCVASNPNTPAHILEKLATEKNYLVRQSIAFNPKTPANLLAKLSQDNDKYVRGYVASHRHTTSDILENLAQDHDKYVRGYVASNPHTPIKLLEKFVEDAEQTVREKLAANPSLPAYLLKQLMRYPHQNVRRYVAFNTPNNGNILNHLAEDKQMDIADIYNISHPHNLFFQEKVKYKNEKAAPCLIRFIMFLQPNVSPQILAENSRSLAWLERYAIAQNSHTPLHTIKNLARDGNRVVRAAAKANFKSRQSQI